MQEKLEISILYDVTIPFLENYDGYDMERLSVIYYMRLGYFPLFVRPYIPDRVHKMFYAFASRGIDIITPSPTSEFFTTLFMGSYLHIYNWSPLSPIGVHKFAIYALCAKVMGHTMPLGGFLEKTLEAEVFYLKHGFFRSSPSLLFYEFCKEIYGDGGSAGPPLCRYSFVEELNLSRHKIPYIKVPFPDIKQKFPAAPPIFPSFRFSKYSRFRFTVNIDFLDKSPTVISEPHDPIFDYDITA
jgi:hypothetical protein